MNSPHGDPLSIRSAAADCPARVALVAEGHELTFADLADAALVVFTSGTSGEPSPIVHSRQTILAACASSASHLGWRQDDVWLAAVPLAHVSGVGIVVRSLVARRQAVVTRFDPPAVLAALQKHRVTIASWVPTQLDALLAAGLDADAAPGLRAALIGGAALAPRAETMAHLRGVPILPTYGMTETFGQVATRPTDATLASTADAGRVGPPLSGIHLEAGRGQPAPIVIRGDQVVGGHLTTADFGDLDERGWLRVVGRADDVIITGGEKVHPQQVEASLRDLAGVRDVAVVGIDDSRWGAIVAALVVLADGVSLAAIENAAAERLSSYMRPRRWRDVPALPRNPSGKVDRRACRAALRTEIPPRPSSY